MKYLRKFNESNDIKSDVSDILLELEDLGLNTIISEYNDEEFEKFKSEQGRGDKGFGSSGK